MNNDVIICNHVKGLTNLSELEPSNVMLNVIFDIMEHSYDLWNTIVIAINFCNAKKMIRSLMSIVSNHYGIKCLIHLEPSNVCLKWFLIEWRIGLISEIQLLLWLISAMQRKLWINVYQK